MNKNVISKNEIKLRFENLWKTIFIFSIPTIIVMTISASYPILDKLIALTFVTPNVYHDPFYTDWYTENISISGGKWTYDIAKIFVNLSTQFASQIYNLLFCFAVLFSIGTSLTFSIKYGQNNKQQTRSLAGNSMTITFIFFIIAAGLVFCITYPKWDNIMIFIQLSKKGSWITEDLTWHYVWPMLVASPLMFISYLLLTLLRTDGKGWIAILITVSSIIVNAFFSIILVKYAHMYLEGTMIGTIISWFFVFSITLIFIFKNKNSYLRFHWRDLFVFRKNDIKEVFRLGFSSFVNSLGVVLVSILSSAIVSHLQGQIEEREKFGLSTFQLFNSAMTPWIAFFTSIALGLSQGIKTIIAYNYGAKKYLRMYQTFWYGLIIMSIWLFFVLILFIVIGPELLMTFAFTAEKINQYRWWGVLMIMSYPFAAISFLGVSLFQGMDNAKKAFLCSSFRAFIILPLLMMIGYFVAHSLNDGTINNNIYYFVFLGLNDLIASICVSIILYCFWRTKRHYIFNEPNKMDQEHLRLHNKKSQN